MHGLLDQLGPAVVRRESGATNMTAMPRVLPERVDSFTVQVCGCPAPAPHSDTAIASVDRLDVRQTADPGPAAWQA